MGLGVHASLGPPTGNDDRAIRPRWPVGRVRENIPGGIVVFGSVHLPAGAEMMDALGPPPWTSVLAFVRRQRRNTQFDRQRCDFAAVFQSRWIGKFELKGDVLEHQASCQTSKQRGV